MEQLLAEVLLSCARQMADREATLNRYTSETRQHELNLSFHFATEARKWFPWLDCDADVSKPNLDYRRPDIIFHRRGYNEANFLVVEIKRAHDAEGAKGDLEKIKNAWFSPRLLYRFGAVLRLQDNGYATEVTVVPRVNTNRLVKIEAAIKFKQRSPQNDAAIISNMKDLVARIVNDRPESATQESPAELLDAKIREFFPEIR